MNDWSPDSSGYHNESDNIPTFTTGNDFSAQYGMNILPPDDLSAMQATLTPNDLFNDIAGMDTIKSEMPDWERQTSSTPTSENTHISDISVHEPSSKARISKARRHNSASTDSSGAGPSTDLSREKNRIAASKCRRKKKVEEQQLEERRRMLQVQHAILQDSAAQLRDEVLHLKNEILKHGTCDYLPIQNYIKQAASQLR